MTKRSRSFEGSYGAGSVVVVPFPYSDRLSEKRRPAVVVSAPEVEASGLLWVLMVTTAKRGTQPLDVPIDDAAAAGLTRPCVVRPTKIACIEPARIVRRAGSLTRTTSDRVLRTVRALVADEFPAS